MSTVEWVCLFFGVWLALILLIVWFVHQGTRSR